MHFRFFQKKSKSAKKIQARQRACSLENFAPGTGEEEAEQQELKVRKAKLCIMDSYFTTYLLTHTYIHTYAFIK